MVINHTHSHMHIAAFVAIRQNSKRLKDKNILEIGGKPSCWHILARLLACPTLGRVSVLCLPEQIMAYVPSGVNFVPRDKGLDGVTVRGMVLISAFKDPIRTGYYLAEHDPYRACSATHKTPCYSFTACIHPSTFDAATLHECDVMHRANALNSGVIL
jgi:hypothetical protein